MDEANRLFSEGGLAVGAGLEDLGKRNQEPGGNHIFYQGQRAKISGAG